MLGIEKYEPETPTFPDVPKSKWFYGYVEAAVQEGIISGYADGTFKPYNNIVRKHICAIIKRAKGWTYEGTEEIFTDVPSDHPYYDDIMACYEHGVVGGYDDNTFRPNNNATRGQVCKMLCLMENIF